jgi:biopolymer transport protein ExbD
MSSRKKKRETDVELNITTFMNLMVVLIPFLLLDAVFTQMSILQLTLPSSEEAPAATPPEDRKPFSLEVLIYKNRYELVDRKSNSVLSVINNRADGQHDTAKLHEILVKLKERAVAIEDVRDITLLCEKDTPYVLLIQTMDTVRITDTMLNGTMIKKELFPDISIGTAPADKSAGGAA